MNTKAARSTHHHSPGKLKARALEQEDLRDWQKHNVSESATEIGSTSIAYLIVQLANSVRSRILQLFEVFSTQQISRW